MWFYYLHVYFKLLHPEYCNLSVELAHFYFNVDNIFAPISLLYISLIILILLLLISEFILLTKQYFIKHGMASEYISFSILLFFTNCKTAASSLLLLALMMIGALILFSWKSLLLPFLDKSCLLLNCHQLLYFTFHDTHNQNKDASFVKQGPLF